MNGAERIRCALRGEQPDSVPIMLHNFMQAARLSGYTQTQFRSDPHKISESFLRSVELLGHDGILVDVDTATLAGAVGVLVEYPADEPAICYLPALENLQDIETLQEPDVGASEGIQTWLEAVRLIKEQVGEELYVRGNCDQAPFSLASMIRGPSNWYMDLIRSSEQAHQLLEYCTNASIQFMDMMAQTGADMLSNGDSPAGPELISPDMYAEFALPYEKQLVERSQYHGLPYTLHICGNTEAILDGMLDSGADALELDYKTNAETVRHTLAGHCTFIGNLDPVNVLERGSEREVREGVIELLDIFADVPGFILNAGCAIPANTPVENLKVMIDTARESSR